MLTRTNLADAELARKLELIRGSASTANPSVRRLAAHSLHTDCQLAVLGFSASIDFDQLLTRTRYQPSFGQSPFAIHRGLTFERMLRDTNHALARELLSVPLGVPTDEIRAVNLREKGSKSETGVQVTADLIGKILANDPKAPHLLDGAVLAVSVGGIVGYFEADALAARTADGVIRVVEVKSFPKVDDRVDPEQLGAALDQMAVYIVLTRATAARLGVDPELRVSDRGLLITPRNVGLAPTLSEQRITAKIRRIEQVFAAVPHFSEVLGAAPPGISFGSVADRSAEESRRVDALHDIADRIGTAYAPSCLTTCGNARFCRERASRAGSPCVIGPSAARLLPEVISLGRADDLTKGATPTSAEAPVAVLLERAGRLIDETQSVPDSPRRSA